MEQKKTLVVGASPNPERYSYKAVERLRQNGHPVYAFGFREGTIADVTMSTAWPTEGFDTVTLYLNPQRQQQYYERILALRPKRVLFSPGTENPPFERQLSESGIVAEEVCTLVLLSIGEY